MPVVFIGHGSPMNAVEDNEFSRAWTKLGNELPKPKAVLCVSAHWMTEGTGVTAMREPRTIHDFFGFPEELNTFGYPAVGEPALAARVQELLGGEKTVGLDRDWGLDHGAWSVLTRLYPAANVPVVQLSLNADLTPGRHYRLGQALAPLRDEGVLILGSGNVVHNLMELDLDAPPYPWATAFDGFVRDRLKHGDAPALSSFALHPAAARALPTNEHYLPLLYALGAAGTDSPRFLTEAVFAGSISMRSVVFGG
jgi:4,5-DOPA dioxygenase extradiol